MYESPLRPPLIKGKKDYGEISEDITKPTEGVPNKYWFLLVTISSLAL